MLAIRSPLQVQLLPLISLMLYCLAAEPSLRLHCCPVPPFQVPKQIFHVPFGQFCDNQLANIGGKLALIRLYGGADLAFHPPRGVLPYAAAPQKGCPFGN